MTLSCKVENTRSNILPIKSLLIPIMQIFINQNDTNILKTVFKFT